MHVASHVVHRMTVSCAWGNRPLCWENFACAGCLCCLALKCSSLLLLSSSTQCQHPSCAHVSAANDLHSRAAMTSAILAVTWLMLSSGERDWESSIFLTTMLHLATV